MCHWTLSQLPVAGKLWFALHQWSCIQNYPEPVIIRKCILTQILATTDWLLTTQCLHALCVSFVVYVTLYTFVDIRFLVFAFLILCVICLMFFYIEELLVALAKWVQYMQPDIWSIPALLICWHILPFTVSFLPTSVHFNCVLSCM